MKIIIPLCIGSSFDSCLYMLVLLSGIEAGGCPVQDGTFSIAHLEDGMYIVEAACCALWPQTWGWWGRIARKELGWGEQQRGRRQRPITGRRADLEAGLAYLSLRKIRLWDLIVGTANFGKRNLLHCLKFTLFELLLFKMKIRIISKFIRSIFRLVSKNLN